MSSPMLVDDSDPAVQYKPGWIWDTLVPELRHTRHGAALDGLTAELGFSGTGIQVIGTLEPTDTNGRPNTTYTIDGELVGTYNAPVTPSGETEYNVTFFSKRDLLPGAHQIVITNVVNSSDSATFWLDFFLIDTSPAPDATSTIPAQTSIVATSGAGSPPSSSASPSGPSGSAPPTDTVGPQRSQHNIGAIVGGVVGGVALLGMVIFLLLWTRRRKRPTIRAVEPFVPAAVRPRRPEGPPSLITAGTQTRSFTGRTELDVEASSPCQTTVTRGSVNYDNHSPSTASLPMLGAHPHPVSATVPEEHGLVSEEKSGDQTPSAPPIPDVQTEASRSPWYAPPGWHSRAQSLLGALSAGGRRGNRERVSERHQDSGLRLYNEPALPPAYTPD